MAYISFQPSDYFNTKLYTGTGSSNAITGVGFQPDWLWIKDRDSASNSHIITDAIRGTNKIIFSDSTSAELTDATRVTSFDSDGFTVGTDGSTNTNTNDYVAWNWKANGSGSANTDGSISSTVSANDTAGFSIVKYTGTGSAGNVGHGLSTAPKVLLNKSISGANDWFVGHSSIGFTKFLKLNATNAESTNSGIWNDTAPTTDHFTINSANGNTNATGVDYITYCFAEKKGFSKFGSYVGNNNTDGVFIYLGFQARFIMIKNISTSTNGDWIIYDTARDTDNPISNALEANNSRADVTGTGRGLPLDVTSTGIKMRHSYGESNAGSTYIYMAFAEFPLVSSNDIPATAR